MPVIFTLDKMMNSRNVGTTELARKVGITTVNLSRLKSGKVKVLRCTTLARICQELDCQPGDLLILIPDKD